MRGGLFPKRVVERVARGTKIGFAIAIALAHYVGQVVLDDIESGKINARTGGRGSGDNEFDRRAGRYGPRLLHVEIGLGLLTL